jgi:ribosome biogenesis GTPase
LEEPTLSSESLIDLAQIGWDEDRAQFMEQNHPGLVPARIAVEYGHSYAAFAEGGEMSAEVSGRMRHESVTRGELPAVGDWVAARAVPGEDKLMIEAVLPRRSSFSRDVAGLTTQEQVLAANVDKLFILAGLDGDLNLRRVERFLTLAWESGAVPIVVLTKTDKADDVPGALDAVAAIAPGVEVLPVCAPDGIGVEAVLEQLSGNPTVALLGSSGVGKSTLINRMLGEDVMTTKKVRWDGKGRHTTSHRQLIPLPGGGAVIDTPGLRELRLWDANEGIDVSFSDITELAERCRFNDCSHEHEPGCGVLAALEDGSLDASRLASFRKLAKELAALERRKDVHLAREHNRRFKRMASEGAARAKAKRRY